MHGSFGGLISHWVQRFFMFKGMHRLYFSLPGGKGCSVYRQAVMSVLFLVPMPWAHCSRVTQAQCPTQPIRCLHHTLPPWPWSNLLCSTDMPKQANEFSSTVPSKCQNGIPHGLCNACNTNQATAQGCGYNAGNLKYMWLFMQIRMCVMHTRHLMSAESCKAFFFYWPHKLDHCTAFSVSRSTLSCTHTDC